MRGLEIFAFFTNPMELMVGCGLLLAIVLPPIVRSGTRCVSLVLRSFDVHCRPQPPGQPLVEIIGRPAGIVAFVLTARQSHPQTKLSATASGIEYEASSLFGQLKKFIPLSRVASISAGLHKPVSYLIVAGLLFVMGALSSIEGGSSIPFVAALLVAAILVVGYFVSKSVLFEIKSNAGIEILLCFRPGVIEGVPVDAGKALAAAGVIRDLIAPGEHAESMPMGVGSQLGGQMAQEWYYLRNGQRQGPVASEKLKELASMGQIQANDQVWKEGMSKWVKAQGIKGLFPAHGTASTQSPPP